MTDLPSHDGKVTSGKKKFSISHQRYKVGNRDYCSHFPVTIETTGKFLVIFVRLILGKRRVDEVTGPQREIDIRYEFDLKVNLKYLGCK